MEIVFGGVVRDLSTKNVTADTLNRLEYIYQMRNAIVQEIMRGESTSLDDVISRMGRVNISGRTASQPGYDADISALTSQFQNHSLRDLKVLVYQLYNLLLSLGDSRLVKYVAALAYIINLTGGEGGSFCDVYTYIPTGFLVEYIKVVQDQNVPVQTAISELKLALSKITMSSDITNLTRLFRDLSVIVDRQLLCRKIGIGSLLLVAELNSDSIVHIKRHLYRCLKSPSIQLYPMSHVVQHNLGPTINIRTELINIRHILLMVSQLEEKIAEHMENLELMEIDGYTSIEISVQKRTIMELRQQLDQNKGVVQCLKAAFKEIVKTL